jgi:hypothetical protein
MSALLPAALATTFAAFCVWVMVRIVNRRERWANRTAVAIAVIVAVYLLSFGPACWLTSRIGGSEMLPTIYYPITLGMSRQTPNSLDYAIRCCAQMGANPNWDWWFIPERLQWEWTQEVEWEPPTP